MPGYINERQPYTCTEKKFADVVIACRGIRPFLDSTHTASMDETGGRINELYRRNVKYSGCSGANVFMASTKYRLNKILKNGDILYLSDCLDGVDGKITQDDLELYLTKGAIIKPLLSDQPETEWTDLIYSMKLFNGVRYSDLFNNDVFLDTVCFFRDRDEAARYYGINRDRDLRDVLNDKSDGFDRCSCGRADREACHRTEYKPLPKKEGAFFEERDYEKIPAETHGRHTGTKVVLRQCTLTAVMNPALKDALFGDADTRSLFKDGETVTIAVSKDG